MKKESHKKGFTIIEVVLVLAIAGLIFLMVFVALPALQRSQRDTQRRDDYAALSSQVTSYSASNGGRVYKLAGASSLTGATDTAKNTLDATKFINATGQDPDRVGYTVKAYTWKGWANDSALKDKTPAPHTVYIVFPANCNGTTSDGSAAAAPKKSDNNNQFAVFGWLETGSYCSESQY